jgi:hypothetical protein
MMDGRFCSRIKTTIPTSCIHIRVGEFWFFLLSQKLSVCKFRLLYVMKANNCIWKIELYVAPVEQEFCFCFCFFFFQLLEIAILARRKHLPWPEWLVWWNVCLKGRWLGLLLSRHLLIYIYIYIYICNFIFLKIEYELFG